LISKRRASRRSEERASRRSIVRASQRSIERASQRSMERASRMPRATVFLLAATLSGCSSASVIDSEPRGATVIVDGVRGVTPFTTRLPITTFGRYRYRAEKRGYLPAEGELPREGNSVAIALSILFPPALLWSVHRAADHVTIRLSPEVPFPAGFAHEEPWRPDLPPLPPGMTGSTRPASSPEDR
jgi:PEGA domain-containing protein